MFANDVFAEIEVMKMVMELRVAENGWYLDIHSYRECLNAYKLG